MAMKKKEAVTIKGNLLLSIWYPPVVGIVLFFLYLNLLVVDRWVYQKGDLVFLVFTAIITLHLVYPFFKLMYDRIQMHSQPSFCIAGLGTYISYYLIRHWLMFLCSWHRNEAKDPTFSFSILTLFSLFALLMLCLPFFLNYSIRKEQIRDLERRIREIEQRSS